MCVCRSGFRSPVCVCQRVCVSQASEHQHIVNNVCVGQAFGEGGNPRLAWPSRLARTGAPWEGQAWACMELELESSLGFILVMEEHSVKELFSFLTCTGQSSPLLVWRLSMVLQRPFLWSVLTFRPVAQRLLCGCIPPVSGHLPE